MPYHASHQCTALTIFESISICILLVATVRFVFKKLYPSNQSVREDITSKSTKIKKKRKRHKCEVSPQFFEQDVLEYIMTSHLYDGKKM